MFEKLKKHWKVDGMQLLLILCVFAITGTLTAYISKQVTSWLSIEKFSFFYWLLKLVVLVFGYQVIILIVSVPFGQFPFFWNYEKKILRKMGLMKKEKTD